MQGLDLDGLSTADLDLRLSAGKVTIGTASLGRTAIATNLRAGKLGITIGELRGFGGVIRGSIGLAKSEQGAEFASQLQFDGVNLERCIGELFGLKRIEGKGNLTVSLEGTGPSVYALTRTLDGEATLTGTKGALTGLNVEQLLRRLERRPLSGGSEYRSGRTPFDTLAVRMKITQGNVTVEEVSLGGPAVRLALAGEASIPARDLDLKGVATLVSASANAKPFELPFAVQGGWDDPLLLPDAQILIQRSGAAAPLLEALRARRDQGRAPASCTVGYCRQSKTCSRRPPESPPTNEPSTPACRHPREDAGTRRCSGPRGCSAGRQPLYRREPEAMPATQRQHHARRPGRKEPNKRKGCRGHAWRRRRIRL